MIRKKINGAAPLRRAAKKQVVQPYVQRARSYEELLDRLGLNQKEASALFGFAHRTSRRYKRGEGKLPQSALILMRLMARGVVTKRQVMRAV